MNNADYLVSTIKSKIPMEILLRAFIKPTLYNVIPVSLEQRIKTEIITNKVCRDCNVVSGIETLISLAGVPIQQVEGGSIYNIGLRPTNGKIITSILSVGYGYGVLMPGQATISSALSDIPLSSDVRVELIGVNTVYMEGYYTMPLTTMRCVLENDAELGNVPVRALKFYSILCVLATKLYIYNTLTIALASGVIIQGVDMGRIKEIVDSYSDAEEMYMEQLEKVPKVVLLSDRVSKNRHIRSLLGGL